MGTFPDIDNLIKKIKEENNNELFYDYLIWSSENPGARISLIVMAGPIQEDIISIQMANNVIENTKVELIDYDFSEGEWSEPRDYGTVFAIVIPDDLKQAENTIRELSNVYEKFKQNLSNILEGLLKVKQSVTLQNNTNC